MSGTTAAAVKLRSASAPSRHVYDVAVIGSQMGGALAAALLARRGYQVLYVDHDGLGPGYGHEGWLLPYAPFVMAPLRSLPPLEEAAAELGLTQVLQRAIRAVPKIQLVRPNERIDLFRQSPDTGRLPIEIERALGKERVAGFLSSIGTLATQKFRPDLRGYPDLPPDGFFSRRRFNSLAKKMESQGGGSPLKLEPDTQLLGEFGKFVTYSEADGFARGFPLAGVLEEPYTIDGGRHGLRELFLTRLKELGGDVLAHDETTVVEQLGFDGSKVSGIKLVRGDTLYRTGVVIGATDAGAMRRLVSDKKKHRELTEVLDGANTKQVLFTVNWVLPEKAIPRGMGELLLMQTATDDQPDLSNATLVQVSHARRLGGESAAEDRVVSASAFAPASARELGEEHLTSLMEKLSRRLEELMPFSRKQVKAISAPYLHASGVRGSRLLPHPLLSFEEESPLSICGLPLRLPVKNLFLASREVLPGLGLEGEFRAGARVAELVHEAMGKTDPLRRAR
ncbi:MAG: desaturase [Myxococcaceae bacterium]